ncbi:MAG: carboxypeptidase-like regulatory domain-containing protein [Planctomycetota bacterium]
MDLVRAGCLLFVTGLALAQVDKAALVGVVVDRDGAAVADAKVEVFECLGRGFTCFDPAFRAEWTPVATSPVDKNGRFGLQVPAGAVLRVQVQHPRSALWRVDEHVLTAELRIPLEPPCTFRGRLLDAATGAGIAGELRGRAQAVTRDFAGRTEIFRGRTDAQGRFEFTQLPAGRFTCMVTPDSGVAPAWWKGELHGDAPCEHDFALAPGFALRGQVLAAATQRPVAGAVIGEGWFQDRPVPSAADGSYTLAGLGGGDVEVACVADGYVRQLFAIEAMAADGTHDFLLDRGTAVQGKVVAADGKPVAGVYVAAAAFGPRLTWLGQRTGADGVFRFAGLPKDELYVVLRSKAHAVAVYHLPPPDAQQQIDTGELRLQAPHLLRATVRDLAGRPVAGARMRLFGINADMERLTGATLLGFGDGRQLADRFAYSDSEGVVCFGAVAAGAYQLGFDAEPMPMVPDDAITVEVTANGAPPDLIVARLK